MIYFMKPIRLLLLALLAAALMACGTTRVDPYDEQRSAEELYEQAHSAARRGDYDAAVEGLERLQARYPFGVLARQAQLDIIHLYYESDQPDATVAAADRYIRLYPRDNHVAYAYYMRAWANATRGRDFLSGLFRIDRSSRDPEPLREAHADFSYIAQAYPNSKYAADAAERALTLHHQLAENELHVARFYMRRGAYIAAARRAQQVIAEFGDTPAYEPAVRLLAEAYDHLDTPELRDEALRTLGERDAAADSADGA